MTQYIDLNSDLGESFGVYTLGMDEEVLDIVTSANVACGFHAGDPRVMDGTVKQALKSGVRVGAHPGFHDRVGFGRRNMDATPQEITTDVLYQLGALSAFCSANGTELQHVKAHGQLYNMAAQDRDMAKAIASAVKQFDPELLLFVLPGSELETAGREAGLRVVREGFADRRYQVNGQLVPRRIEGAVLHNPDEAAAQALQMVTEGTVTADDGTVIEMPVETLCVHGDNPAAVSLASAVVERLEEAGVVIQSVSETLANAG